MWLSFRFSSVLYVVDAIEVLRATVLSGFTLLKHLTKTDLQREQKQDYF